MPSPELFVPKDIRKQTKITKGRIDITLRKVMPEVAKQIYITNIPALSGGLQENSLR